MKAWGIYKLKKKEEKRRDQYSGDYWEREGTFLGNLGVG